MSRLSNAPSRSPRALFASKRQSSAATRVALVTAGLLLGATVIVGGAGVGLTYWQLARSLDRSILDGAASMARSYQSLGDQGVIEAIRQRERLATNIIDFTLFDSAKRPLAGRSDVPPPTLGWHDMIFPDPVEGGDPTRVLMLPLKHGETLMVAGNRRPLVIAQTAIGWLFLASMVFVTLLCTTAGWLLQRYLNLRLLPIVSTANAVMQGEFGRRVLDGGKGDEFDQVAASLNSMLDRIADLITNLQQVTSDLAHDLRTPLTRIRNGLERALDSSPDQSRRSAEVAIIQIDDVVHMFEAILRISEIDGSVDRDAMPIDLQDLVIDIVDAMEPAFEAQGIKLGINASPGCIILADRMQVTGAIINLLENVLRHASAASAARVTVRQEDDCVVLTVSDSGPGVPDADRERIFKRFVRLDRSRSAAGHGLGLSMVDAVAKAHKAALSAQNVAGGFAITLEFPAFMEGSFTNAR